MKATKSNHSCQIDCTNHDQVINSLQLKSKDLYYFWRNYEWLYNKYYSQQQQIQQQQKQPQPVVPHREYEEQISKLTAQNRKLKVDNQSLKRQIQSLNSNQSMSRMQEQFQKQINRLNSKCKDYQGIREKQTTQISNLMRSLKQMEREHQNLQSKYKKQLKKKQEAIVNLQTTIDELRSKQLNTNFSNKNQGEERVRRQIQKVTQTMSNLELHCYQIIEQQMDLTRQELLRQFPEIFNKFASSDNLSQIIVQEFQQN